MHSWLTRILVSGALMASAAGGLTVAAQAHPSRAARHHAVRAVKEARTSEAAGESAESGSSSDSDAAAQAAACQKAGVTGENVNYDGQTGTCTADNSGANNQQG